MSLPQSFGSWSLDELAVDQKAIDHIADVVNVPAAVVPTTLVPQPPTEPPPETQALKKARTKNDDDGWQSRGWWWSSSSSRNWRHKDVLSKSDYDAIADHDIDEQGVKWLKRLSEEEPQEKESMVHDVRMLRSPYRLRAGMI